MTTTDQITYPARQWASEAGEPEPHPAPEVPMRDALDGEIPGGARMMRKLAEANGWTVRATYARGTYTTKTTARVVDSLALRMVHADGWQAVAVWHDGTAHVALRGVNGQAPRACAMVALRAWLAAPTADVFAVAEPAGIDPPERTPPARPSSPTVAGTWATVHVGDTVTGADQRAWTVVERGPEHTWVAGNGAPTAHFRLQLGDRVVMTSQRLTDPAFVAGVADDRGEMAAAWSALGDNGVTAGIVRESMSDATESECTHPIEAQSVLRDGRDFCTDCRLFLTDDVPGASQAETPAPDGGKGGDVLVTGPSVTPTPAAPADPFMTPGEAPSTLKRVEPPFGKYGWYKLPNPTWSEPGDLTEVLYPRVSTIAKTLKDEYGLTAWKLRMVAKGVSLRPDLIAVAAAADVEEDKSRLDEVVKSALEKAEVSKGANFGTAMHKFAERLDAGESIDWMGVPESLIPDLHAYVAALKEARLTVLPEYSERTVVNASRGYAGTIDRIVRDRDGVLRVLDVKTGKDVVEYGSLKFGTAQALYANAEYMCSRDFRSYEPMPAVDRDKSFILHLPIGQARAQVYALDISKGARAASLAFDVRATQKDARSGWLWAYSPGTPADAVMVRIGRSVSVDELMTATTDAKRIGAWSDELERYALTRYDLIRAGNADSREALAALWAELHPAGRWTDEVAELAIRRASDLAQGAA